MAQQPPTPIKKPDFPWHFLGAGQLFLFLLTLIAFLDMNTRLESTRCACCLGDEDASQINEIREKRSLKGL